jgi:putative endonuclease
MWYIYFLECKDKTIYCGITNNLQKRLLAHNTGKGSKYVLSHGGGKFVYIKRARTKSSALKQEYKLKLLPREQKQKLIANFKDLGALLNT